MSGPVRSRAARELAERALVRLVSEYGSVPEFVLLGGLVPDLLCSNSPRHHIGTTDVDVQVNLEIQGGSMNSARLEHALVTVGFKPDSERVWRGRTKSHRRWSSRSSSSRTSTTSPTRSPSPSTIVSRSEPRTCDEPLVHPYACRKAAPSFSGLLLPNPSIG